MGENVVRSMCLNSDKCEWSEIAIHEIGWLIDTSTSGIRCQPEGAPAHLASPHRIAHYPYNYTVYTMEMNTRD